MRCINEVMKFIKRELIENCEVIQGHVMMLWLGQLYYIAESDGNEKYF